MGHERAGRLPEVSDEAGDTPGWLPFLGLGIIVLFVSWMMMRDALTESEGEAGLSNAAHHSLISDSSHS